MRISNSKNLQCEGVRSHGGAYRDKGLIVSFEPDNTQNVFDSPFLLLTLGRGTNLKCWAHSENVVSKTLDLFDNIAHGSLWCCNFLLNLP